MEHGELVEEGGLPDQPGIDKLLFFIITIMFNSKLGILFSPSYSELLPTCVNLWRGFVFGNENLPNFTCRRANLSEVHLKGRMNRLSSRFGISFVDELSGFPESVQRKTHINI